MTTTMTTTTFTLASLKRNRFSTFAESAPTPITLDAWDTLSVPDKVAVERSLGIQSHHWTDADEAEMFGEDSWVPISNDETETFAEKDWQRTPTKRTQNKWRNVKTGAIRYSKENPGKGNAASPPATETKPQSSPSPSPSPKTEPKPEPASVTEILDLNAELDSLFFDSPHIAASSKSHIARAPERAKALEPIVAAARKNPEAVAKKFDEVDRQVSKWEADRHNNGDNDGFFDAVGDTAMFNVDALIGKYGVAGAAPILLAAAAGGLVGGSAGVAAMSAGMWVFGPNEATKAVIALGAVGAGALSLPVVALVHSIRSVKRLIFGKSSNASTYAEDRPMTDAEIARAAIDWIDESTVRALRLAKSRGLM